MPVTQAQADALAHEWIEAWNRHDIDAVLIHYSDDVIFTSPFAVQFAGKEDGTVHGKKELRAYWEKALAAHTNLHFTLHSALPGLSSVVIYYKSSVRDLTAAETMVLDSDGKVVRVFCHYS
eukprot:TRINITY_DN845_c0_g1_i2.p1 TRINITY_DN845_c0_g1~~TRINITY_DN845_c0_g1_i2.p1  ORF type:complete len:121 (+),score=27.40 TRINITY_DN845_c0_g1_i2:331-693(+)